VTAWAVFFFHTSQKARTKYQGSRLEQGPFLYAPSSRTFFKKGFKKIKFEKGVAVRKNLKNGCLPPDHRAGGVGPGTSRPTRGRDASKAFCRPLPRAPSRIRKFLIREGVPEAATRPARGREASRLVSGRDVESHFFIIFLWNL
jgi:hypothetical protein